MAQLTSFSEASSRGPSCPEKSDSSLHSTKVHAADEAVEDNSLTADNAQLQYALGLHKLGRLDEAETGYRAYLETNPRSADALHLMGVVLSQKGQQREAAHYIIKALRLAPKNASFHNSLGNALQSNKKFHQAIRHYDEAIRINADYAEAFLNRGSCFEKIGRPDDALISLDRVIEIDPSSVKAHVSRGKIFYELREYLKAAQCYERALDIKADPQTFNDLGLCHYFNRNLQSALDSFNQALCLDPNNVMALYNRGSTLAALKDFDQALESFDRVIALRPTDSGAHENRGNVLREMRLLPEAIDAYERAYFLRPYQSFLLGWLLYTKHQICKWDGLEKNIKILNEALSMGQCVTPGFPYLALCDAPDMQKKAESIWATEKLSMSSVLGDIPFRESVGRIKIGYFSADFHNHATAFLIAELIEIHDRTSFEIIGFSFGPDGEDDLRKRLANAFDEFHNVRLNSSLDIARLSRELKIDIAIDLKGYTTNSRPEIFSLRCAPIQVSYLGYPGTTGAPNMDYIIADPVLIPDEFRDHYTENVVYLPDSYQCNDRKRKLSTKKFTRQQERLPEGGFVFCCFNNNYKILPHVFDTWMDLLREVPGSVLWLFESHPAAAENLRKEAQARGVQPERLVFAKFLPLEDHLARYQLADLFLDTLPCNAHTTASDALWAGVPVLTQIGKSFAARVASSLLTAMRLPELITHSAQEYKYRALELARDRQKLQDLRAKVLANRMTTALFDTPRYAYHLEQAYKLMMKRHLEQLPPADIRVEQVVGPLAAPFHKVSSKDFSLLDASTGKKSPNRGLQRMLDEVRLVLNEEGIEATLRYVSRIKASDGKNLNGQTRILSHLAFSMLDTDTEMAIDLLEHAKRLDPEAADPYYVAISFFYRTGRFKEAYEAANFVIASATSTPIQVIVSCQVLARWIDGLGLASAASKKMFEKLGRPLAWASTVLDIALQAMDWDAARELIDQLKEAHIHGKTREARETPRTNLLWCADQAHNLEVVRYWSERDLPLPNDFLPPAEVKPMEGRRLRIGYLSGDFRNHPTSFLLNGLLRHHDREKFELFAYCSGWNDNSDMRQEVLSHFSRVHSVTGLNDADAARMIRSHGIDVLVDLNGPTNAHRMGILAHRPAPVQIDYLGYPGSVGGRVVDYVVGDYYTVPSGIETMFPEKVIRLDSTYQVNDYAAYDKLPAVSRSSQGLPEGVPILGVFNAINKVRHEVWEVWMSILREVPDAILWILDPGKHCDNIIDRVAKANGITNGKRIFIAPKRQHKGHLARLQCADLMLDTWPYSGHTTTSDALFAGVPVLAMEGTNFAGRVSGSLLRSAGLSCLIRPDTDDYVATAVFLLRDNPNELARLQNYVREEVHKTDLFAAETKTRQLETAYRKALDRAAKGLLPKHLSMKRKKTKIALPRFSLHLPESSNKGESSIEIFRSQGEFDAVGAVEEMPEPTLTTCVDHS